MRPCHACLTVIGLSVIAFLFGVAVAQDKPEAQPAASVEKTSGDKAPAGAEKMQKMMEEWAKANQPGKEHELLKKLAGKWSVETTFRMTPDMPEMTSKGTDKSEMVLADRYLKSDFSGEMMGQPFKGMSLMGYDTMKKKYVAMWVDEMTTGFTTSEGTADSSGKTVTFTGESFCPSTNKVEPFRHVVTMESDDKYTFEGFGPGPDGKEFRMMKLAYTREK
jgi:hypothetical protein